MKSIILTIFLACYCLTTPVFAEDSTKAQCLRDASSARNTALLAEQTTFKDAQTSCRGPCFEACRNTFQTCSGPFESVASDCRNAAQVVFATASSDCQASSKCGTPTACFGNHTFQTCLVDPRVALRVAGEKCNSTEKDGLKAANCASTQRACNKLCEPKK